MYYFLERIRGYCCTVVFFLVNKLLQCYDVYVIYLLQSDKI